MKRKTTHAKLLGAGLALALALLAPAAAHGTSVGDKGPAGAVPNAASPERVTLVGARSSGPARLRHIESAGGRTANHQAVKATTQGGLGWREAAVGAGIVIGILLFGLWGDVAVGAAIVGAAALPGVGATLFARGPRGGRARSVLGRRRRQLEGQWRASWLAPGQERQ